MTYIRCFIIIVLTVLFTTGLALAQETIVVGDVINAATGEPVPNANIYYQGTKIGTTSDAEGSFSLRTYQERKHTLLVSAIGFHTQRYTIQPGQMAGLVVALREKTAVLEEVIALPGENPAIALMAQVRARRKDNDRYLNNTERVEASLTKELYVSHIGRKQLRRSFWQNMQNGLIDRGDSTYLLPLYRQRQTVSLHAADLQTVNTVEEQTLILTSTDYSGLLQYEGNIDFYKPNIVIHGHSFISPLASSGAMYYRYWIADSLASDSAKTYIVHFRTRNPFYDTFNGEMYIDSATYALRRCSVTVPRQASSSFLSDLSVTQTLAHDGTLVDEKIQILLDFAVTIDTARRVLPTIMLNYHLSSLQPSKTDSPLAFDAVNDTVDVFAAAMDSMRNKPAVRVATWLASVITTGYIPTGTVVDIGHIQDILQVNDHEKVHLALPLRTNERLMKNVCLEASVGYGIKDRAWKGMGRVMWNMPSLRRNILSFEYHDRYVWSEIDDFTKLAYENGMGWHTMDFTAYAFEAIHTNSHTVNTAARHRQFELHTENDWTDNLETNIFARVGWVGYGDSKVGYASMPYYTCQSLGCVFRVGWRERKVDSYFRRVHVYSDLPVLYAGFEAGSYKLDGRSYQLYASLNIMLRQRVSLGIGGQLDYLFSAGCVLGNVPYPLLHHFEGNQGMAFDPYRFTLMNNFQYMSDRWIALHLTWNGKGILFNLIPGIRYLRWHELLTFKLAYGGCRQTHLCTSELYGLTGHGLTAPDVPYVELGCGIGNILRIVDVHSVWRLTNRKDTAAPLWAMRFRFNLDW